MRGAEYVADILKNAFDEARRRYSPSLTPSAAARMLTPARPTALPTAQLPPPLHEENADIGDRTARCYGFVKAADYRKTYGQSSMYRALQPIEWQSVWCDARERLVQRA